MCCCSLPFGFRHGPKVVLEGLAKSPHLYYTPEPMHDFEMLARGCFLASSEMRHDFPASKDPKTLLDWWNTVDNKYTMRVLLDALADLRAAKVGADHAFKRLLSDLFFY